ncbi:MAG: hypothetical protein J6S59_08470 [Clostridia bacterium]|nr:hypothetical protein [Clostridia bacterium]
MDDLSAVIQSLLQDPQSMAQIQSLAQSLGLNDTSAGSAPAESAAPSALLPQNAPDQHMMTMLMQAAPLLSAANREDDATRLLSALRPLLGELRQKKLDEASRILKLLRLLPLLRESGVLQNIL